MKLLFLILCAYFLGSIPFGKMLGYLHHKDIQKHGSGNIGFANAWRVLGWKTAIWVLAGDSLKGFAAVYISRNWGLTEPYLEVIAGIAVFGHVFPFWLRFKGGKGVATAFGALLALNPILGLTGLALYGIGIGILRKSYKASLFAMWALPFAALLIDAHFFLLCILLAAFGTWTHRDNIKQMRAV